MSFSYLRIFFVLLSCPYFVSNILSVVINYIVGFTIYKINLFITHDLNFEVKKFFNLMALTY